MQAKEVKQEEEMKRGSSQNLKILQHFPFLLEAIAWGAIFHTA